MKRNVSERKLSFGESPRPARGSKMKKGNSISNINSSHGKRTNSTSGSEYESGPTRKSTRKSAGAISIDRNYPTKFLSKANQSSILQFVSKSTEKKNSQEDKENKKRDSSNSETVIQTKKRSSNQITKRKSSEKVNDNYLSTSKKSPIVSKQKKHSQAKPKMSSPTTRVKLNLKKSTSGKQKNEKHTQKSYRDESKEVNQSLNSSQANRSIGEHDKKKTQRKSRKRKNEYELSPGTSCFSIQLKYIHIHTMYRSTIIPVQHILEGLGSQSLYKTPLECSEQDYRSANQY